MSAGGGSAADPARLEQMLWREAEGRRLPGLGAAVWDRGERVWAGGVGSAEIEAGIEAGADVSFRIGSITKTFVAAAIFQLRDAGRLDLDQPIATLLPQLSLPGVTPRNLLAHVSGLARELPGDHWTTLEFPTRDHFLDTLPALEPIARPWRIHHYSNLGYMLLGEVVSQVSGVPLKSYVEANLLDPLGLRQTGWEPQGAAANGYFADPDGDFFHRERIVDLREMSAAGQLWSTATDLIRWAGFLVEPQPQILAASSVAEMGTVHAVVPATDWQLGWGPGLAIFRPGEAEFRGHGGGLDGFRAALVLSRERRIAAVVWANARDRATPDWEPIGCAIDLCESVVASRPPAEARTSRSAAMPAALADIVGRWWCAGVEYMLGSEGGRLRIASAAGPGDLEPTYLEPVAPDLWRSLGPQEPGERLRVIRDEGGGVSRFIWAGFPYYRQPAGDTVQLGSGAGMSGSGRS